MRYPFVSQPFNLRSFRAISGAAIFYGSRLNFLNFLIRGFWREGLQTYAFASFKIKIVCFESLDTVTGRITVT